LDSRLRPCGFVRRIDGVTHDRDFERRADPRCSCDNAGSRSEDEHTALEAPARKVVTAMATRKQKLRAAAAATPLNPVAKAIEKIKTKKTSRGK
jgi:hypothetical protein